MVTPKIGMQVEYGSVQNAEVWQILGDKVRIRYGKYYNEITLSEWHKHIESTFIVIKK